MRVVAARCSAIYTGRGDTTLGPAVRALLIKSDGSVSIHNEVGNKPLNYMKDAIMTETLNEEGNLVWTFDSRKESLSITLHEVYSDAEFPLVTEDEGLVRDGTEKQLQEWISRNPECIGEGFTFVQREFPTGNGPVDLLVRDAEGNPVVVEVKRVAMLPAVDQVRRYAEALRPTEGFENVRAIVAALDLRPRMVELAKKRNIETVELPKYWREQG